MIKKMFAVLVFLCIVSVSLARPQYVEIFRMVPAVKIHEETMTPTRSVRNQTARTSYYPYHETWEQFKTKHGKTYESPEIEEGRKAIFMENVKMIELHNIKFNIREKNYFLDINQFADMTNEEFRAYNGFLQNLPKAHRGCSSFLGISGVKLPTTVDWRKHGYVTPVKNQKQCGSCWSFSTTGSLEGQNFKKTGKLISLSEQQLVDCSGSYGNEGCNGGLMDNAFSYIKANGIETEEDYPYKARQGRCHYRKSEVVANDTGCMDINKESETDLKYAVATVGPVSIAIDASHTSFQFYKSGVYDEPECSSTQLDHGVLVVGYGTLEMEDYWLVKNSWGTIWGDEGYIYMSRNKDNQCGIATSASYPLV